MLKKCQFNYEGHQIFEGNIIQRIDKFYHQTQFIIAKFYFVLEIFHLQMTHMQDAAQMTERNGQIKKLLEAIANYNPTHQEMQSMKNAKRQMLRNIQKKYAHSQINSSYTFPFINNNAQHPQQNSDLQSREQSELQNLYQQNFMFNRTKSLQKKGKRVPLQQMDQNSNINDRSQTDQTRLSLKVKSKQQMGPIKLQKANNARYQTPKIVKKQIVLNNKKRQQRQPSQIYEVKGTTTVKSKLKIKKPNTSLNITKKDIPLKTQNNINFKPYYDSSVPKNRKIPINLETEFQQESNDQFLEQVIFQENSEESILFNTNQNIDENTNLQYPKQLFNVSGLKQKLRQSSKDLKKVFTKRHKRNATQGGQIEIKIKLFSSSFKKQDSSRKGNLTQKAIQTQKDSMAQKGNPVQKMNQSQKSNQSHKINQSKKQHQPQTELKKKSNISKVLFQRNDGNYSSSNILNRTLSSVSHQSIKKGIKICSKGKQYGQKSLEKSEIKNYTVFLKQGEARILQKRELKHEKQNMFQNNKTSKINSIMQSLKQGYKTKNKIQKNTSKPKSGIKNTICT